MNTPLQGKTALVTGGARGIGAAIVRRLHADGANVAITDVLAGEGRALAAELGAGTVFIAHDVSNNAAWTEAVAATVAAFGQLDIVVNNAGVYEPGSIAEADLAGVEHQIRINQFGTFLGMRHALAPLRAAGGGAIVNLASAAGKFGFPLRAPYAASKFGVIGLTETLAIELGPDQIRVNAILPGVVAGERQDRVLGAKAAARGVSLEEQRATAVSRVSMGRMVEAEDIAQAVLYLAGPGGRYVSGERLSVGGNVESLN